MKTLGNNKHEETSLDVKGIITETFSGKPTFRIKST